MIDEMLAETIRRRGGDPDWKPLDPVGGKDVDDQPFTVADAKVFFEAYHNDMKDFLREQSRNIVEMVVRDVAERIPYASATGMGLGPKSAYEARLKFEADRADQESEHRRRDEEAKAIYDMPMSNAQARALDDAQYAGGNPRPQDRRTK